MVPYTGRRQSASTTTHSKADALSEREFELLLQGARSLPDDGDRIQAVTAVLVTGRLGLRTGEFAHLQESWIDWQRSMIQIPRHERCEKSRQGDVCGYCRQRAKQKVEYADEDIALADALRGCWSPKTAAAVRDVPFEFSVRCELALENLVNRFGEWPLSCQGVYRRVKMAAEQIDGVSTEKVRPHGLRATAASYHAARGLETLPLQAMMGWSQLSTAEKYVATSSENTRRALNSAHSR